MESEAAKVQTPILAYNTDSVSKTLVAIRRGSRTRPALARRSAQRGFTLLELLVVITIVAMASVLVVPNIGSLESRSFTAQIRQANTLLNYARRIAVVNGNPSAALFSASQQQTDDESEGESPELAQDIAGRWQSYGTALRFRDSTDQEIEIDEDFEIVFFPEGGSTGGTLIFQYEDQEVKIEIDPFTGRISTEYPE